jgi:uncharacterized protein (DUF2147 family)
MLTFNHASVLATTLAAENGEVSSSNMRLIEGGKKLNVRGYVAISWLGRSQTWIRQD